MIPKPPKLPELLERKIYKTGQTRGADDDAIYQNRVGRMSTVLIPYDSWDACSKSGSEPIIYDNGFIVLIPPLKYFVDLKTPEELRIQGLELGKNALVFYETRQEWERFSPAKQGWKAATRRLKPLRGQYIARIPATTAAVNGGKISYGFTKTKMKGAGIRVYEYATEESIKKCRLQLEGLYWRCADSKIVALANGMKEEDAINRKVFNQIQCDELGLMDVPKLVENRILNKGGHTICPLCLKELFGTEFFTRMEQAEGRAVSDNTVTEVNLFHIQELRTGALNHRPYNLGWGHHHCNVVVRDKGIFKTLKWMHEIINRNVAEGHMADENKVS